jgi:hypothetical protein
MHKSTTIAQGNAWYGKKKKFGKPDLHVNFLLSFPNEMYRWFFLQEAGNEDGARTALTVSKRDRARVCLRTCLCACSRVRMCFCVLVCYAMMHVNMSRGSCVHM